MEDKEHHEDGDCVVHLEHVNLNIGKAADACLANLYFFRDVLGLNIDPDHRK